MKHLPAHLYQKDSSSSICGMYNLRTGTIGMHCVQEVMKHGVRNSLLVAPMPTASTSQILGNNECFEPYTSNIYVRRVLSGEFIIVNKHLLKDLVQLGLWNDTMKNKIIAANGSIQNINEIPGRYQSVVQDRLGN